MKKILIGLLSLAIISCHNREENEAIESDSPNKDIEKVDYSFKSQSILFDNKFPVLTDSSFLDILHELNLCELSRDTAFYRGKPFCTSNLFRFFKYNQSRSLKDNLLIDTRAATLPNTTTKVLIVAAKTKSEYKVINFYHGKLVEMRTTTSGYNDLVIKYRDPRVGQFITIRHEWDKKIGAYMAKDVEEIQDHFVKPEYKDSLNKHYLTEFAWGY